MLPSKRVKEACIACNNNATYRSLYLPILREHRLGSEMWTKRGFSSFNQMMYDYAGRMLTHIYTLPPTYSDIDREQVKTGLINICNRYKGKEQ